MALNWRATLVGVRDLERDLTTFHPTEQVAELWGRRLMESTVRFQRPGVWVEVTEIVEVPRGEVRWVAGVAAYVPVADKTT